MPRMRWHPETGENKVFGDDEQHPPEWLDHHPEDPAYAPAAIAEKQEAEGLKGPPKEDLMTKAEVIEALTAGGLEVDGTKGVAALREQLTQALRDNLNSRSISFTLEDGPRRLLALAAGEE